MPDRVPTSRYACIIREREEDGEREERRDIACADNPPKARSLSPMILSMLFVSQTKDQAFTTVADSKA